jgi:uncharacterized repeat protein (TIGR02543 family)
MKIRKPVLYALLSLFCLVAIALPAAPTQASGAYITLTPSSGPPGQTANVNGHGFLAYEPGIHVLFDGQILHDDLAADAYGDWALSFHVLLKPPGVYNVTAYGQNTTVVGDTYEIIPRLIISSTAGGLVTAPGEGLFSYGYGTVVNLVATPASGYRFINWTGDVGTIADVNDPTTTITMNGHYSILANFEQIPVDYYTLTTAASPVMGGTAADVTGASPYMEGEVVSIQAAAASGYQFVGWSAPAGSFANSNAAQTTFTMPSADVTITANFEVIPAGQYSLTVSSTTGGSVTTPGEGVFAYDEGTWVELQAVPDGGYYFVNWDGDVGTIADVNAATTTITMQGDYKITARFLADAVDAKTETVTGGGTVDARDEADTEVEVDGTATVTVALYEDNPGGDAPSDFNALDKYIDVYVPDTSQVTELEIRLYYTDAEVAAANVSEESLRLFWWDGHDWVAASDSGVNTANTDSYSGYMWAKIRSDTTPTLDQLQGTEWGGYGHPSEAPQPLCSIATAAYGTDTAKEIDILREFRDTVLLPNSLGVRFVSLYYITSPPIANFISQHEVLRKAVRVGFVDPIVKILNWSHDLWWARDPQ